MLKHNQHGRYFIDLQRFARQDMSGKSAKHAFLMLSLLRFNYNGINKKRFLRLAHVLPANFSRDTKQLQELNFFKVIDHEIFVNPSLLWAGSARIQKYRQLCYDQAIHDTHDSLQPQEDAHWLTYIQSKSEVLQEEPDLIAL